MTRYQEEVMQILASCQTTLPPSEMAGQLADLANDAFAYPCWATYDRRLIDRMAALDRNLGLRRGQICQICRWLHEQDQATRATWLRWLQGEAIATVQPQASRS